MVLIDEEGRCLESVSTSIIQFYDEPQKGDLLIVINDKGFIHKYTGKNSDLKSLKDLRSYFVNKFNTLYQTNLNIDDINVNVSVHSWKPSVAVLAKY
jgi:hypothetical protein